MHKLVSICMPAFNAAQYITQTIHSLLAQSYANWELIVVDDNSTDDTNALVSRYSLAHTNIHLFQNPKKGAASARNLAYSKAKGEYLIFLDADDIFSKDLIEKQLNCIDNQDTVVVCKWGRFYNNIYDCTINWTDVNQDFDLHQWIKQYWYTCTHTTPPGRVMITRNLMENAGTWDEDLTLNDDFAFFTRIFSKAKLIKFNNHTTFFYRSGIGGLSSSKSTKAYWSSFHSIDRSCEVALKQFKEDEVIKKACANLFQNLIYELYPKEKEIIKACTEKINQLGGSDFPFPAGGYSKKLAAILGWKATKRIQGIAQYFRNPSN